MLGEGEMKRIWRRLNERRSSSFRETQRDERHETRVHAPPVGGASGKTKRHVSTKEAIRRFRTHAFDEKKHADVVRLGVKDALWSDLYHHALTASWMAFTFWAFMSYVLVNLLFALLYALVPGEVTGSHPLSFLDLFFFSVQTLSTVGYGGMVPSGVVANVIVSFEVLLGMMVNALAAGAVFARIARPRARIIFSDRAVISDENGVPALCIRIANCRRSLILSVDAEVALSRLIVTHDGHLERRFEPLTLVQAHVPVLRFAFVLAHVVTEVSPLHRYSLEELKAEEAEIIVTVTGTDEAMGQTVFARTAYAFDKVLHNHRFVDIIHTRPSGGLSVDYSRFHDIEAHIPPRD
ncbi:ion channel [Acetobacter sp.]|uniref:ion channel n=1 Tax=Acetobacter sp. TaxID=440 RepID=UPI00387E6C4B